MQDNSKSQIISQTGAQQIVNTLQEHGVEYIFGYPGGAVIPLYDALYDSELKHILTRHEQGAAHAADGYARATGKVGVVVATSGPGATNIVTGLATAHMDSVPMVAITGQVPRSSIGLDSFQEADIYGISIPITKYNYLAQDPQSLKQIINEAFYLASTGRPGPILIDIPKDLQVIKIDHLKAEPVNIPGYNPKPKGDIKQIEQMIKAIDSSQKPLLYLGGGAIISEADKEIFRFACELSIPVVTTLMAKGIFPEDHPLALGMLGMHGAKYTNLAVYESDLILCLGARFDDRVAGNVKRFAPKAKIVHVDIDAAEISKRVNVDIAVTGDVKLVLEQALTLITPQHKDKWLEHIKQLKQDNPLEVPIDDKVIRPQALISTLSELTDGQAIIVTDVGQHQMWAAQYIVSKKPRNFLTSGGLGTMGFGLPAAIGAQLGRPGETVVMISGDGGFQMNIQELATIRQYNLPIKMIIVNNGCLGMVRQWQKFFFQERYSNTIFDQQPDFIKIAEGYGIKGRRVENPFEMRQALEEMLAYDGPALYDFWVAPEENVLPMIPAGGGQIDFYDVE